MKLENIKICCVIVAVLALLIYKKFEKYSGYHHRSTLASTYWLNKPQVQHTLPELGLQYPCHKSYFRNVCRENNPNNSELCKYHKHRFDPNQF